MKHLFNDVLELLLIERKNGYSSLATVRWERTLAKRTSEYFADVYIEDIDELRLVRYFSFIRYKEDGEIYSDKYLKSILNLVRAVFKKAVHRGYITQNPFDGLKLPKGNVPIPTERIVDNDELRELLQACSKSKLFSTIIPLLAATGMRIGEALGLFWSDIDFEQRFITVSRAVSTKYVELPDGRIVHDGAQISTTKTQTSVRVIPISSSTAALLRSWYEWREEGINAEWRKNIQKEKNLHLVFPNKRGQLMNYFTLHECFAELIKKELGRTSASFHKLRHSYASNLVECGVDIGIVSKLLGHKSITTTANTYVKIRFAPKAAAVDKLEKYMQENDLIL